MKKVKRTMIIVLAAVILLVVLGLAIYMKANSLTLGGAAGSLAGSVAGAMEGKKKGEAEGKEEGLSAKDTSVDIANQVSEIGKLEVLSADVVMHDNFSGIGGDYKSLVVLYGDITFTVDLSEAEIRAGDTQCDVEIPPPVPELRFDEERTEQLDVDMKHFWSGSSKDGYTATNNTFDQVKENAEESVANYAALASAAEESAKKQVAFLVQSASKEEVSVNVTVKGTGDEGNSSSDAGGDDSGESSSTGSSEATGN